MEEAEQALIERGVLATQAHDILAALIGQRDRQELERAAETLAEEASGPEDVVKGLVAQGFNENDARNTLKQLQEDYSIQQSYWKGVEYKWTARLLMVLSVALAAAFGRVFVTGIGTVGVVIGVCLFTSLIVLRYIILRLRAAAKQRTGHD
jgi:hypothetical protein